MDINLIIMSRLSRKTKIEVLTDIAHNEGLNIYMLLTMHNIPMIGEFMSDKIMYATLAAIEEAAEDDYLTSAEIARLKKVKKSK